MPWGRNSGARSRATARWSSGLAGFRPCPGPYCHAPLRRRLVVTKALPGERRFLPQRAAPACPECGRYLAANAHWSEWGLLCAAFAFFYLLVDSKGRVPLGRLAGWAGAGLLALAIAVVLCHFRYWRHMQRCKPHEVDTHAR